MRKTFAALGVALILAACGGGSETEVPTTAADTPLTPFISTVNKAHDVADAVDQHTADLEAQLNSATP